MKIGIIGTGNMGRTLGGSWAQLGHQVFFGARDPSKAVNAAELAGPSAYHGSNDDAARFGEVVFWNPRIEQPETVLCDPLVLAGKILIDPNNGPVPPDFRFTRSNSSFAQRLAANLPGVRVVKAFNTIAQEVFDHERAFLRRYNVSAFIAGDDPDAKATVAALAAQIGLEPIDAGGLAHAVLLEELADFIRYMMGGMSHGPFATISVVDLPPSERRRFGGRQASRLP